MGKDRILVVDDEPDVLEAVQRMLEVKGFEVKTAHGAAEAMEAARDFRPALVLSDIKMPKVTGVELAREIREAHPDVSVILMTAYASVDTAIDSLKLGVDDYIMKPIDWAQALTSIRAALARRDTTQSNRKYVEELRQSLLQTPTKPAAGFLGAVTQLFASKTADRVAMVDKLETFASAIGARDPLVKDHSKAVGTYVGKMAECLGFSAEEVWHHRLSGLLHDIGKIGLPDTVISKRPQDLNAEELNQYKEHPIISHRILQPVREFQPILKAVLHHHESFDGKGYPDGLSGPHIPTGARMIAVADRFSYLTATDAADREECEASGVQHLMAERGLALDPEMVDAFIQMIRSPAAPA